MGLNPWLRRFPQEGMLAGNIVISYGEIELRVAMCLGKSLESQDVALRTMFRIMGESSRISAADALMRSSFKAQGLEAAYADAIGATKYCVSLRNQYAHCSWADHATAGVFFTRLDEPARATDSMNYHWRHVDVSLLQAQWDYMDHAGLQLDYLNFEYLLRTRRGASHGITRPSALPQPRLHNPPLKHIPPWLTEDEQRRHVEYFQGLESDNAAPAKDTPLSTRQRREARMLAAAERKEVMRRIVRLLAQKPIGQPKSS